MNIFKIFFWIRIVLLSWLCFTLISGGLYIETGIIALFILTDLLKSRLDNIEKRLRRLEGK